MKVDFSAALTGFDGEPLKSENGIITLSIIAVNALSVAKQDATPIEKIRRGRLAERAFDAGETEISPEDLTLIRQCIGEMYPPLIVLKAYRLLGDDEGKVVAMKAGA